ncbi:hypothetical protein MRB53_023970 [Persea americana]|uniref:Uncharacterized protein n=1 Tax=Persea americana TaxID=3435 RepID=A0ACC2LC27_PERAE|nr:hypothetical protein MRB53_023970 [Persea americana]
MVQTQVEMQGGDRGRGVPVPKSGGEAEEPVLRWAARGKKKGDGGETRWGYCEETAPYEGLINKKRANTARALYNLLFEKYSDICRLYKDLCSSIEAALCALFNYEGTVEDLPSFTMELLRAKLLELVDFNTRDAQWES